MKTKRSTMLAMTAQQLQFRPRKDRWTKTEAIATAIARRNDRDVVLLDVNGDSWLHMVAAVVCGGWSGLPKHITHPRSHINLRGDPPAPGN